MIVRINLLPHRELKRQRQKHAFFLMTGLSVVAGAALVLLVWSVLEGYLDAQNGRNKMIADENRKLDAQIKEIATLRQEIEALRARQKAVEDLQADRNEPVYLLDELTRQTPEGIYLRSFKQEDRKVTITGWAASNERVSEFLRNLTNNGRYVQRPELIEIKLAGTSPDGIQRRLFDFSMDFYMKPSSELGTTPGSATAGTPAAPAKKS
ncbi:MAG TPA: PilN domain-containing protein [Burkholderiaceae bacterium]